MCLCVCFLVCGFAVKNIISVCWPREGEAQVRNWQQNLDANKHYVVHYHCK